MAKANWLYCSNVPLLQDEGMSKKAASKTYPGFIVVLFDCIILGTFCLCLSAGLGLDGVVGGAVTEDASVPALELAKNVEDLHVE